MRNLVLTIDLDTRCAECRQPGATQSGLCLKCAVKAMRVNPPMKSEQGRAVQESLKKILRDRMR